LTSLWQRDAHLLNGKIGEGGSPIILKSTRGQITLARDDDARLASLKPLVSNSIVADNQPKGSEHISSDASIKTAGFNGAADTADAAKPKAETAEHTSEDVIKLEARLVNLNVKVVDSMGRPLPNLKKEEFILLEDSSPQDVSYFEPVTAPLNVVLLLDLSGSTDSKMKVIKKAAKKFVDSLNKDDRVAVAAFTRRFFVISNFTSNHEEVKDRIGKIKNRHSGTAYYDAMWATLDMLDEVKQARKAIVVMTDGVDNSIDHPDDSDFNPKHGFDELIARIQEADASIYPIFLDTEYEVVGRNGRNGHDAYVTARKQLQEVADQTGTEMFKADRAEDLENVYKLVAAELHSLYSIGYAPKELRKDGQWRKVSVKVNREGARARTRRGYFAK
jgi:Ca-activated chloride channel family protein